MLGSWGQEEESRTGWRVWRLFCLEEGMEGGERVKFVQVKEAGVRRGLNSGKIFRGLISGD